MLLPTRRLSALVAVPAVLSLGLIVDDGWWWALLVLDAAVVAVAAADAFATAAARGLEIEVDCARTWSRRMASGDEPARNRDRMRSSSSCAG